MRSKWSTRALDKSASSLYVVASTMRASRKLGGPADGNGPSVGSPGSLELVDLHFQNLRGSGALLEGPPGAVP